MLKCTLKLDNQAAKLQLSSKLKGYFSLIAFITVPVSSS